MSVASIGRNGLRTTSLNRYSTAWARILGDHPRQEVDLISGAVREAVWHVHVVSPKTPWVAVVIPDGNLSKRREVTGSENPPVLSDTTQVRSKTP